MMTDLGRFPTEDKWFHLLVQGLPFEEGDTDPMPCRVEGCGEPFADYETKLCEEHASDDIWDKAFKWAE